MHWFQGCGTLLPLRCITVFFLYFNIIYWLCLNHLKGFCCLVNWWSARRIWGFSSFKCHHWDSMKRYLKRKKKKNDSYGSLFVGFYFFLFPFILFRFLLVINVPIEYRYQLDSCSFIFYCYCYLDSFSLYNRR